MSRGRSMERRPCLAAVIALLLVALSVPHVPGMIAVAQTGGSYDLTWSTIDDGGETFSTGGDFALGGTIGQPDAGELSAESYTLAGGFWSGAGYPTAVTLAGFWVEVRDETLTVRWQTASEVDTLGFHLYRSDTGEPGSFNRLNADLIPSQSPGSPAGAVYEWVDAQVAVGQVYFYLLEGVDMHGTATRHGPVAATLPTAFHYRIYLPLVGR